MEDHTRSEQQEELDREDAGEPTPPGVAEDVGDTPAVALHSPDDRGTFVDHEADAVAEPAGTSYLGGPEERATRTEETDG
jgi:hypothetical protein